MGNKKFCNQECCNSYKTITLQKIKIEKWKKGEITGTRGGYGIAKWLRKYLIQQSDNRCSICGWNEINSITKNCPLEIDHIDGDWTNNTLNNVRVLCPNCHSLTETFGSLNSGKGRGSVMRGSRLYK
jgi:hypothetical protein